MAKRISKHKNIYLEDSGFVFVKDIIGDKYVCNLYRHKNKNNAITYLKYYPQNNGVYIYNVFGEDKKEAPRFLGVVQTTKQLKLLFEILDLEINKLV